MKLYHWFASGHGQYSFFVCAENKRAAKSAVNKFIKKHLNKNDEEYLTDYSIKGWGTEYYKLSVSDPLEVVSHPND